MARPSVVRFCLSLLAAMGAFDQRAQAQPAQGRDSYGDLLPGGAVARLGTVRFRHGNQIHALSYSPDGKLLASAASIDGLRVWEATTGKEWFFAKPPGAKWEWFSALAFSPDSKIIAAGSWDGNVHLLESATGKVIRSWRAHFDVTWRVIYAADGKSLATAGRDGVARIWDVESGHERQTLGDPAKMAGIDCAWSSDGKTLVTMGRVKHGIRIWDALTGRHRLTIDDEDYVSVPLVVICPDQKTLLTSYRDVRFWDLVAGKRVFPIQINGKGVSQAAFSPDGKVLAIAGHAGSDYKGAHCFEWATGKLISQLPAMDNGIGALAFTPDGKTLAVAFHDDACIRFFDWKRGTEVSTAAGHTGGVSAITFSPGGTKLYSGGGFGVRRWDVATGKEEFELSGHTHLVRDLVLASDGRTLAVANNAPSFPGPPGAVFFWDVDAKKVTSKFSMQANEPVQSLSFSPTGRTLLCIVGRGSGYDNNCRILHAAKDEAWRTAAETQANAAKYVWDAALVASMDSQSLKAWEPRTGRVRWSVKAPVSPGWHHTSILSVTPNGQWLVLGGADGQVHIFEAASGQEALRFKAHKNRVYRAATAADGRTIAFASHDGASSIYDLASGKKLADLTGHRGPVLCLSFSPSGQRLATGSWDSSILLWSEDAFRRAEQPPLPLTEKDLDNVWDTLGKPNAPAGFAAIWNLIADPARAVPLLESKLRKVSYPSQTQIREWIENLDSDEFPKREDAQRKLAAAGHIAEFPLLQALGEKRSVEFQRRADVLLSKLNATDTPYDLRRARRAVQVLEAIGSAEAQEILRHLERNGIAEAAPAMQRIRERGMVDVNQRE